jgi:hypothetical protein
MIITKLQGGLGNQMFQYAVGRHLAEKNDVGLLLDSTGLDQDILGITKRKYSLSVFNIQESFATDGEIAWFKKYRFKEGKFWFWYNRTFANRARYVWEKQFHFEPWILSLKDPVYLDGFWNAEKYFIEIEPIIRDEFTVKVPLTGRNKEIADTIHDTNAISLHVRRADYVTNPQASTWHGACNLEYYTKAVSTIVASVKNPHFFVFSDDMPWAKENIKLDYPITYVDQNDALTNYEDLRLMSLCKHNIVANSTFSWWGAWLNSNPDKIVIAPQKWFKTPKMDTRDVVPDTWVRL